MGARSKSLLKFALLLVFVGVAIWFFRYTSLGQSVDRDAIRTWIESRDPIGARLLYVLMYIVGTVVLLPGLLLSFVGAVLFGVWEGTLYTWIGATIGASLAFLAAQALGRDFVNQILKGNLKALDERLREHALLSLFILRLVPLFPFNGVNFGCGLTSVRFRDYLMATAIGIVPGTLVYQYLFATLNEKVLDEGFEWRDLLAVEVLLPIGLFAAFVVVGGLLARRLRGRGTSEGEGAMPR